MIFIGELAYNKSNQKERGDFMYPQDEIRPYIRYFPRNDTYMIMRPDGSSFFSIDGQPEIFRRWGKSQIYVGYHGTHVVRFEPHLLPKTIPISTCDNCPQLGGIAIHRLVAECWVDEFLPNSIVSRHDLKCSHPNAASNLIVTPNDSKPCRIFRPEDYDVI